MYREVKCHRPSPPRQQQIFDEVDLEHELDSVKVQKQQNKPTALTPAVSGISSHNSTPLHHTPAHAHTQPHRRSEEDPPSPSQQQQHHYHHPLLPMPTVKSGLRIKPLNRVPSVASILLGLLGWGSSSSLDSSKSSHKWVASESVKEEEEEDLRSR